MECKHWETAGEEKDALWFCGGVGVEGDKESGREGGGGDGEDGECRC